MQHNSVIYNPNYYFSQTDHPNHTNDSNDSNDFNDSNDSNISSDPNDNHCKYIENIGHYDTYQEFDLQCDTIKRNLQEINNECKKNKKKPLKKYNKFYKFYKYLIFFIVSFLLLVYDTEVDSTSSDFQIQKYNESSPKIIKHTQKPCVPDVIIQKVTNVSTHICRDKIIGFAYNPLNHKTSVLCNWFQGWTEDVTSLKNDFIIKCKQFTHVTSILIDSNTPLISCSNELPQKLPNTHTCFDSMYAIVVYRVGNITHIIPKCTTFYDFNIYDIFND